MFTLPTETGQRIEQALAQRVCTANDGSYIRRSSGRRRAGRNTKYTVHLADGKSFVITALDDGAAVEIANKRAAQHCVEPTCPQCGAIGGHYLGCITFRAMQNSSGSH